MLYYIDYKWDQGWLNFSILLFIIMRVGVSTYWGKFWNAKIREISVIDDEIPSDYSYKVKQLMYPLTFTQGIVFVILCLMILKPNLLFFVY